MSTLLSSGVVLFTSVLLMLALLIMGRNLYIAILSQPHFHRNILIVGTGMAAKTIARTLTENGNGMYHIVGFVDDDPAKIGSEVQVRDTCSDAATVGQGSEASYRNVGIPLRVLGDHCALPNLITGHSVSTLVVAITHQVSSELLQALMDCLESGVEILPMPLLYERLTGRVPVEYIGNNWCVAMPVNHPGTRKIWPIVKRAFDLTSASLGLICLGIAFPLIALAIYLDSPGPIFYTQERVGKGGRTFRLYKFRSMRPGAENGKAIWASKNDERVTRVGYILRKTHIDEFPQFLNIIKGEMSAVGPRPERPEFVNELTREIPFYRVRHAVKPGMAGWGLVKQGYGSSKEDALLKLQYDLYYIKHQSLWLDIVILFKTIVDTLTFRGR
ncbi:MAG: sugar transferase [Nitrospirae bacterium]|nr:sugar transferase [Nitrospirota bacterium]